MPDRSPASPTFSAHHAAGSTTLVVWKAWAEVCGKTLPGCQDDKPRPLSPRKTAQILPYGSAQTRWVLLDGAPPLPWQVARLHGSPCLWLTDAVEEDRSFYGCGVPESAWVQLPEGFLCGGSRCLEVVKCAETEPPAVGKGFWASSDGLSPYFPEACWANLSGRFPEGKGPPARLGQVTDTRVGCLRHHSLGQGVTGLSWHLDKQVNKLVPSRFVLILMTFGFFSLNMVLFTSCARYMPFSP